MKSLKWIFLIACAIMVIGACSLNLAHAIELGPVAEPFAGVKCVAEFEEICESVNIDPEDIYDIDPDDSFESVYYEHPKAFWKRASISMDRICADPKSKIVLADKVILCAEKANNFSDEEMEDVIWECQRTLRDIVCPNIKYIWINSAKVTEYDLPDKCMSVAEFKRKAQRAAKLLNWDPRSK